MDKIKYLIVILILTITVNGFCEEEQLANIDNGNNHEQVIQFQNVRYVQTQNIEKTQNQNETNNIKDKSFSFIGINANFFLLILPLDAGLQFMYCPKGSFGFSMSLNIALPVPLLGFSFMPIYKYKRFFIGAGFNIYFQYKNPSKNQDYLIELKQNPDFKERVIPSVDATLGFMFGSKTKFGIALNFRYLLKYKLTIPLINIQIMLGI